MWHVLCFRKFSRAKHCIGCFCKGSAHPSMAFVVCSDARRTKYSFECPLKLRRNDKCALLCFRKLSRATRRIYYVCGGPSQQRITFTDFRDLEGKISVALSRFRRISRAKPCIFCEVPTPNPTKYALFIYFGDFSD